MAAVVLVADSVGGDRKDQFVAAVGHILEDTDPAQDKTGLAAVAVVDLADSVDPVGTEDDSIVVDIPAVGIPGLQQNCLAAHHNAPSTNTDLLLPSFLQRQNPVSFLLV